MNPDNVVPAGPTAAATSAPSVPPPSSAATAEAAAPMLASPPDAGAAAAPAPLPDAAVGPVPLNGAAPAAPAMPVDSLAPAATHATPLVTTPPDVPVDALAQAADHSLLGLIIQAGPVVQGVMGALILASVICWAIMIEKSILLGRLQREVRLLSNLGDPGAASGEGPAARIQRAAAREWAEGRDHDESRIEYRERIERAMRETLSVTMRRAQSGTAFLATTGAVGPFVGLFGTVWGIMGSFQGIAQMHDTSLAVVAPGIAEALLATAMGLIAAIPAVVIYNHLVRMISAYRALLGDATAQVMLLISRDQGRRSLRLARAAE